MQPEAPSFWLASCFCESVVRCYSVIFNVTSVTIKICEHVLRCTQHGIEPAIKRLQCVQVHFVNLLLVTVLYTQSRYTHLQEMLQGWSPLHHAAANNHVATARALVSHGAAISFRDNSVSPADF